MPDRQRTAMRPVQTARFLRDRPARAGGRFVTALFVFLCLASSGRAGLVLDTVVMTVAGQSTYSTYGSPITGLEAEVFGGGRGLFVPSNPLGLAASNIAGAMVVRTAASG